MKCPYCNQEIKQALLAAALGMVGGRKSKRVLTTEQARNMVKMREIKREKKGIA